MVKRVGKKRVVKKQGGAGLMDVLKKANDILKKTKIISTLGKAYGSTGGPGASTIGRAGALAGNYGYGKARKPRKRGGCNGVLRM